MPDAILVFDVGTTNFKTVLFDPEGETLMIDHIPFRPAYGSGGLALQDPHDWLKAVVKGGALAAAYAAKNELHIVAASITASRSSLIPVDRTGANIAPALMWQETVSRDVVNRLSQGEVLERIYRKSGSRPTTLFGAPKMTWLRENKPETYDRAHKLVGIQDYIICFLTGDFVTDHSFGSRTLLMHIENRVWDDEMLEVFNVDLDKLCRLIRPGSIAGRLTPDAARQTGLPEGLPIVTAGGDQQCAAMGAGLIGHGDTILNLGTGSYVVTSVDRPFLDLPQMRVVCNASAHPEKWIIDAAMGATGSVHRWFVESIYSACGLEATESFRLAEKEAAESPPGAGGIIALPYFSGCGAPRWNTHAKGVFYGFGLDSRRHDLSRAILEGIACEIRLNLETVDGMIGGIRQVKMAGGFTQSAFNNQLLADVLQRRLILSRSREATARGAWSQAMVAMGLAPNHLEALGRGNNEEEIAFDPNPDLAPVYAELMAERDKLYESLGPMHGTCR